MQVEARYRIVTPLYMGGAEPQRSAELRPASIRGALRFWYRALVWSRYKGWEQVRNNEEELFGSTVKGIGKFYLSVVGPELESYEKETRWSKGSAMAYLGYGLDKKKPIKPNQTFMVKLFFPNGGKEDSNANDIIKALKALSMLGGLGARSRRGFGSVNMESLLAEKEETYVKPESSEELKAQIREIVTGVEAASWPDYTALSRFSRIVILPEHSSATATHRFIGEQLQKYRKSISGDSHLVSSFARGAKPNNHPQRVAFGLPHNYFFRGRQGKVQINGNQSNRRASPLLIHIHQVGAAKYVPVLTFLPGKFLPQGEKIKMKHLHRTAMVDPRIEDDGFAVINEFLDQFPGRLEVV